MRNPGKEKQRDTGRQGGDHLRGLGRQTGLCSNPGSNPRPGWLWVSSLTYLGLLPHLDREPVHLPTWGLLQGLRELRG